MPDIPASSAASGASVATAVSPTASDDFSTPARLAEPDLALARDLFDILRARGNGPMGAGTVPDGVSIGVTRDTYGDGEQHAHDLLRRHALELGLEAVNDAAGNLYLTLPGSERGLGAVLTGSHMDSVPNGGNYDGGAGVVAGLAVLAGWVAAGHVPRRDVTVMAIRAEESNWFPISYVGSKAAFGLLPASALDVPRSDTGRSLATHMRECGAAPERVAAGEAYLSREKVACFFELHIEQGPVLVEAGEVLGIVTGICGSLRYRHAGATGTYAHSGATPRTHRRDAVVAVSMLVLALQEHWAALEEAGHELTVTVGQFATDPVEAGFSKVAGRVDFCIDIRSRSPATLAAMDRHVLEAVARIGARTGVVFDLGEQNGSKDATMDAGLRRDLAGMGREMGLALRDMPSGAGHDAANFAAQGIPTAMVFMRNENGSHNPGEKLEFEDFARGARLMARFLERQSR